MEREGRIKDYVPPTYRNNKTPKIQRIREGFQGMLGLEGMDYTFFINTDAQSYDRFELEVKSFGLDVKASDKHEFDSLDAIVSADLWMFGSDPRGGVRGPAVGAC